MLKTKFSIKNNNFKKKSGYVLIIVMLIVASISLLVMSVTYRVFTGRALISTLSHFSTKQLLLTNGIAIVQSMLSQNSQEEEKEDTAKAQNLKNKNEHFKKLFKMFWKNAYKWTTYTFSEEEDGASGKINIYLMCESGKLPIGNIIETILKHNKEKDKKSEGENSNNSEGELQKNITANESKESTSDNNDGNIKADIFKKENMKFWKAFFSKNIEKSEIFKNLLNNDSKKEKDILKKWVENFNNYKQKIEAPSIFYFLGTSIPENILIYSKKENLEKNNNKQISSFKIGDLLSTYSKKLCIGFLSPALISIFAPDKFSFDEKTRESFLKNIENNKELNEKTLENPEKAWDLFFKKTLNIQFPKEFLSEIEKNNLLCQNSIPNFFSAIISIEFDMENLTAFVLFEKITSSNDDDIDYLVKQIIFY
jgi:hypothetical protein